MSKLNKFKKRGHEIKLAGKDVTTIVYPNIVLPQYFDNSTNKYNQVEDEAEANMLRAKNITVEYGGLLLIKKGTKEAKLVKETVDKVWNDFNLDKNRKANYPIEDGDEKADKLESQQKNGDMYRGHILIKTGTQNKKKKFQSFNKYGVYSPKTDDEINGFFCRLGLYIGYYESSSSVLGVKAYLNAIQYMDKNPDVNIATDYSNEFDFESAGDEEFEKAVGRDEDFDGGASITDDVEDDEENEVFAN